MYNVTLGVATPIAVLGGMGLSVYSLYSRSMHLKGNTDAYEEIAELLKRLSDEN